MKVAKEEVEPKDKHLDTMKLSPKSILKQETERVTQEKKTFEIKQDPQNQDLVVVRI